MSETMTQQEHSSSILLEKEGKYLTFALAQEEYGLEILKVREIIGYMDITAVPQTPPRKYRSESILKMNMLLN